MRRTTTRALSLILASTRTSICALRFTRTAQPSGVLCRRDPERDLRMRQKAAYLLERGETFFVR